MSSLSRLLSDLSTYEPAITKCVGLPESDGLSLNVVAEVIDGMSVRHPDYSRLAGRVLARWMDESVDAKTFSERMEAIQALPSKDKTVTRKLNPAFMAFIREHKEVIDRAVDYKRNYSYTYIGLQTVKKVYLGVHRGKVLETAQDWHMRVAVQLATGLTGRDKERALQFCLDEYEDLSLGRKVYATPICCNAGYYPCQLSSCFLVYVPDSIEGIYERAKDCAMIHASMGGCAISMHTIRAMGSLVKTTGGEAAGLIAFAKNFDHTSKIVQSGGRRSGSNTLWMEPHHLDILDLLTSRTLGGDNMKLRTLFQGLMLSDLFMERAEANAMWTLFDPANFPGLDKVSNEEFRELYAKHEKDAEAILTEEGMETVHAASGISYTLVQGKCATIRAMDVWNAIKVQISDNSSPFLIACDAVNRSNQHSNRTRVAAVEQSSEPLKGRGYACKTSNLCNEILQYVDEDETAVCTLGNLSIVAFVKFTNGVAHMDYEGLHAAVKRMTIGLNSVLDTQVLPTKRATLSSKTMRAIGIGVQGLANALIALEVPFDSAKGREVNRLVAETLYHAALEASCELAQDTQPYHHYKTNGGSYLAQGKFHWEVDGVYPHKLHWDWETLRESIRVHGVANSLVTAYAPTATTSIVLGNEESIQPLMSNIVQRSTLAGDFSVVQPSLCAKLETLGLWSEKTCDEIIRNRGSISTLPVSDELKAIYRTAYEISTKSVIDMQRDRCYFIDQGQSVNLFVPVSQRNFSAFLDTAIFYSWKIGNKNLMYYCRQEKEVQALNVNLRKSEMALDVSSTSVGTASTSSSDCEEEVLVCRREPGCLVCE